MYNGLSGKNCYCNNIVLTNAVFGIAAYSTVNVAIGVKRAVSLMILASVRLVPAFNFY